jgi:hypothetical protein
MICELAQSNYEQVRPIFSGLTDRVAIQAIIEGSTPGRIFVDDANQPTMAFL